jgi:hypothetical protein
VKYLYLVAGQQAYRLLIAKVHAPIRI